jgi:hypothetical protein
MLRVTDSRCEINKLLEYWPIRDTSVSKADTININKKGGAVPKSRTHITLISSKLHFRAHRLQAFYSLFSDLLKSYST